MKLILASNSPRRKALLKQIGLSFVPFNPNIDEEEAEKKIFSPKKLSGFLAFKKAKKGLEKYPDDLILAADTVVSHGKKILGKPTSKKEALKTLLFLNGKKHYVTTAVAVAYNEKILLEWCTTQVWFLRHKKEFLKKYVETGEPLDKAGAYGIQGMGALLVKKIEGDYFNVVGLPLVKTVFLLQRACLAKGKSLSLGKNGLICRAHI